MVKNHLQCRRPGFDPWVRSPGGGNGNPLQYSCMENLMDRGAWWESNMTDTELNLMAVGNKVFFSLIYSVPSVLHSMFCLRICLLILCVSLVGPQCPDMCSDLILDVSVRGFLDEINIYIGGLWVKQIAFHSVGGPHPIIWRPDSKRRLTSPEQEHILSGEGFWTWTVSLALPWVSNP